MTRSQSRLRFGVLMFPIHRPDHDPTLQLEGDRLGFDEFWFGEHHSGGRQIIASPELMIAAASRRTSRIRPGTGVATLSYHHPLTLLDRIVQLDHLTRGRLIFGVGAGALALDIRVAAFRAPSGPRLEAYRRELRHDGLTRRTMAAAQARAGVEHAREQRAAQDAARFRPPKPG